MPFEIGKSGNQGGRPKGVSYQEELQEALDEVANNKDKSLLVHAIEQAYVNNGVIKVDEKWVPNPKAVNLPSLPTDYYKRVCKPRMMTGSRSTWTIRHGEGRKAGLREAVD